MNQKFTDYFAQILPSEELKDFLAQVGKKGKVKKAFRINTLLCKNDPRKFKKTFQKIEKLPWSDTGYFYESEISIGNTEEYAKGWVYSQEASSQIAVELLDVKKGQMVLDLCASPGSKTTHIAMKLKNDGFIIANEIDPERYSKLRNNLRHYGSICHAISSLDPAYFATHYPNTFDRILVDAPCSGEGMYFKFPAVLDHWNMKTVKFNAKRQKQILTRAFQALKPGGKLVYSTCTLNLEENEKVIQFILKKFFGNAEIENIDMKKLGLAPKGKGSSKEPIIKFWPHIHRTGGFFACVITKKEATETKKKEPKIKLTSRQRRQAAHKTKNKRSDAKASWKICSRKETMSIEKMVEAETGVKNFTIPENFVVVKKGNIYFLQPRAYYKRFAQVPVRLLGMPLLVTYDEVGKKRATSECLRWLNLE